VVGNSDPPVGSAKVRDYANIDVSRTVTPFSSIAFRRAGTRADIGKEILALREELKSVRSRLLEAEDALFFATQQTEANAQQRWNEVFDEL
jgi:hypothetical protein